ncbi:MAG: hypothetical protein C4318_01575 [Acidimicrobiia bacterium]
MRKWRKMSVAIVAAAVLGGLLLASAALAQDKGSDQGAGSHEAAAEANKNPGRWGQKIRGVIGRHTMRESREIFLNGKTVVVKTYKGQLVSSGDSKLTIKYLDGTTGDVQLVGEVKVCANGNAQAGLGDLQSGKPVRIHTATNLPRGDVSVVIQASSKDELKGCRDLVDSIRDRLRAEAGASEAPSQP